MKKQPPCSWCSSTTCAWTSGACWSPSSASSIRVEEQGLFYSILPTATQYARNALFAGMMPSEIEKRFPGKWISEDEEGSKNANEDEFIGGPAEAPGQEREAQLPQDPQPERGPQARGQWTT
jgi:hypothetical protein